MVELSWAPNWSAYRMVLGRVELSLICLSNILARNGAVAQW